MKKDDNLYDVIDIEGLESLNTENQKVLKEIFRREEDRLKHPEEALETPEGDPEMIIIIP